MQFRKKLPFFLFPFSSFFLSLPDCDGYADNDCEYDFDYDYDFDFDYDYDYDYEASVA